MISPGLLVFTTCLPDNAVLLGLPGLVVFAVTAAWFIRAERKSSAHYKKMFLTTVATLGETNAQQAALRTGNELLHKQVMDGENTWDFVAGYLANGGAVLALTTLSKSPSQTRLSQQESGPPQGSEADVFVPIPACPVRSIDTAVAAREPVLVLTSKADDTDDTPFHIVVLRPADTLDQAVRKQLCSPVFVACIEVSIRRDPWPGNAKRYEIFIEPVRELSRGAASLAMNWLLDRAGKEGVQEIGGSLTQSIINEAHRGRLYHFYVRKHGFGYTALTNRLSKVLPANPDAEKSTSG